jgi:hypothetical protein
MWDVKISVNGNAIFSTGSIVSIGNQPIEFRPLPSPNDAYRVEIVFKTEVNPPDAAINYEVVDSSHFKITLTNFTANFFIATQVPIYVANFAGRKVLLHVASSTIGRGDAATRLLLYTFLDGGSAVG